MPDERIVLEIDDRSAVAAQKRSADGFDKVEAKAKRATGSIAESVEDASDRVVRLVDKSQTAIDRVVRTAEQKARFAGKTALERLEIQRGIDVGRVSGDPRAVERITAAYSRLIDEQKKADSAASGFGDRLKQALENPRGALDALISGLTGLPGLLAAGALAVGGLAAGVYRVITSTTDWAEQLSNVAIVTGLTRQEVQLFTAAAQAQGVSAEILQTMMRGLSKTMQDTSPEAMRTREELGKMGVQLFETGGQARSAGKLLLDIADALGRIEDPYKRAAEAQKLFGRSGIEALKLFNGDLRSTIEEFNRLGIALNEEAIAPILAMDKRLDEAGVKWDSWFKHAKAAIVGVAESIATWLGKDSIDQKLAPQLRTNLLIPEAARAGIAQAGRESFAANPQVPRLGADPNTTEAAMLAWQARNRQAGAAVIAEFQRERERGVVGLQARLGSLTEERATAMGQLGSGLGAAAARTTVAEVQRLDKEIAGIQSRIKEINEAPAKAEAAKRQQEALEKSILQKRQELIRESQKTALDAAAKEAEERIALEGRIAERRTEYQRSTGAIHDQIRQQGFDQELIALQRSRDQQIRALDAVFTRTLEQKLAVEQEKLRIEQEFLDRSRELKGSALQRQTSDELSEAYRLAETKEDLENRLAAVRLESSMREKIAAQDAAAAMATAQQEASNRQTQLMQADYEKTFDRIQNSFEGLLDAMFSRSRSWGSALSGMLQAILLTPIKQGLSMMVAGALTGQPSAGGGFLGRLGGFGGLGMAGFGGLAGAPGGTVGFNGPVQSVGPLGTLLPSGLGRAGFSGLTAAGVAPLALGGSILGGLGAFKLGQRGGIGGALAPGLGAVSGLLGFGALTALFPSLLAAGPAGWIAAGGIGAFVGLMGLWRGKAEDRVREKIKQVYGVTIREKNILQQIMAIAKEGFGGNIDVAIRSQPVKDIIDLYQMTFGGTSSGLSATPRPVSVYQSGGQVFQSPSAYSSTGGASAITARSAGVTVVMPVQVVGAKEFFAQETTTIISNNGRAVVNSAMKAQRSNVGRTRFTQNQLAPNLITS